MIEDFLVVAEDRIKPGHWYILRQNLSRMKAERLCKRLSKELVALHPEIAIRRGEQVYIAGHERTVRHSEMMDTMSFMKSRGLA